MVRLRAEPTPLAVLRQEVETMLAPHLMRYDQPGFQSMFNAFPERAAPNL